MTCGLTTEDELLCWGASGPRLGTGDGLASDVGWGEGPEPIWLTRWRTRKLPTTMTSRTTSASAMENRGRTVRGRQTGCAERPRPRRSTRA